MDALTANANGIWAVFITGAQNLAKGGMGFTIVCLAINHWVGTGHERLHKLGVSLATVGVLFSIIMAATAIATSVTGAVH